MFLIRYSWYYILCETWTVPECPLNFVWSNIMELVGKGIVQDFWLSEWLHLTSKHTIIDSFRNFPCGILLDSRIIEHFKRKGTGNMEISWTLKWTWRRNISFDNNVSTQKLGTSYIVCVCEHACVHEYTRVWRKTWRKWQYHCILSSMLLVVSKANFC